MDVDIKSATKAYKIITLISVLLLAVSTVLNVFLSQKIRNLTNIIDESNAEGRLDEGETAAILEAKDLTGKPITLSYSDVNIPTVLYTFTPQCHWCFENLENIKFLAKQSQGKFRLIGLSLNKDELESYLQKNGIDFPIYTDIPANIQADYKFGGTPQTIVISRDGKVIKNWVGIYTDEVGSEVENYFSIKLPASKTKTALLEVPQ
jgi:peroxiredoxin